MANRAFARGYKLWRAGKFTRAIDALKRAAATNPQDADAYNHLGLCYDALGDYETAILHYEKAADICARHSDAGNAASMKVHIAESLISWGRHTEAEALLNEILSTPHIGDARVHAYATLARSFIDRRSLDEAERTLRMIGPELLESHGEDEQFVSGICSMLWARVYIAKEEFDQAGACLIAAQQALRRNKSAMAELEYYFGQVLIGRNQPKRALKHYQRSWKFFHRHEPSFARKVVTGIAEAYEKDGNAQKAESWRRKAEGLESQQ